MSKFLRYDTAHDVRMRLHGSVCMYKNVPVWVIHDGTDTLDVTLRDVRTNKDMVRISSSDPDLDISSVPLGYALSTKKYTPIYYFRTPARQQKQGVAPENVHSIIESWETIHTNRGLGIEGALLADLIEGKYPPVDQIEKILSTRYGCSFHREYCIVRDDKNRGPDLLRSRGMTMGFYDVGAKVAFLLPPFHAGHHRASLLKIGIQTEVIGNVEANS